MAPQESSADMRARSTSSVVLASFACRASTLASLNSWLCNVLSAWICAAALLYAIGRPRLSSQVAPPGRPEEAEELELVGAIDVTYNVLLCISALNMP